jgi:hypothetical protein
MEIKGKLKSVSLIQEGTGKDGKAWRKCEIIVEEQAGDYPNALKLDVMNAKIDNLPDVGSEVCAIFKSKVSSYNNKNYNNITLWSIQVVKSVETQEQYNPFPL